MSEMPDTARPSPAAYFLPLRRHSLVRHLARGEAPLAALEQAGLLAATLCRTQSHPPAQMDRLLHDACALFADNPNAAAQAPLTGPGGAGQTDLDAWLADLAQHGLLLAPDAVVEQFIAADPAQYPGAPFQSACLTTVTEHVIRFPPTTVADEFDEAPALDSAHGSDARAVERTGLFTSEQARVLRAIAANPDELIDLEGYAGTGKGHLVLALLDARPGRYTYVAPSRGQVEAFRPRVPVDAAARLMTQIEFANAIVQHAARSGQLAGFIPTYRQSTLGLHDITARIGLRGIGPRTAEQVLLTVFEGINRWCASSAPSLQSWHFQRALPWAMVDAAPYVAAAELVWRCMFDPVVQKGGCLSLNVGHIGKWLWLRGVDLPLALGMVLVDEAHDLSPAWKQLLSRHAPGVVSLGDPHQRLVGRATRWSSAKVLEMHQSVRQGSQVDHLVNQSLALDDDAGATERFSGATDRATGVRHYAAWSAVPVSGMRIFGSVWRLLREATQLVARGAQVHVHPASVRVLLKDAQGPIDAWRSVRERGPTQRWDAFVAACGQRGQADIPALFSDGFDAAALERLIARLVPQESCTVMLCLAQHAKNLQSDTVAMSACCFTTGHDARAWHNPVRAAYLALTRARHQLWVPGDAMDQLQDSAQRHAQARDEERVRRRRTMGAVSARR